MKDICTDCTDPASYIDIKGFIYCDYHGKLRKAYMRCRRLSVQERVTIRLGKAIERYEKRVETSRQI